MYHKKSDGDMGSLWLSNLSKQLVSDRANLLFPFYAMSGEEIPCGLQIWTL